MHTLTALWQNRAKANFDKCYYNWPFSEARRDSFDGWITQTSIVLKASLMLDLQQIICVHSVLSQYCQLILDMG